MIVQERSVRSRRGLNLYRLKRIKRANSFRSNHRRNTAIEVNNTSDYVDYFISGSDLSRATKLRGNNRPIRIERPIHNDRPIIRDRPRGDRYGHDVCYENPRSRVVSINRAQQERGSNRVAGGIFGAIAGQIIGGDLGDAISLVGAGFAVAGAIDLNQSREVIFEDSYNCRQYYQVDNYRHNFRNRNGRNCTTTRFYTSRWGSTTEYFETTCRGGSRYMTFQRHRSVWR